MEKIGGLLICQPSAEGTGINSGSRCKRKRVFGSLPNQPAKRGSLVFVAWRSCTNTPATAPGPALRYLYEHQAAKSTFQSCKASGTLPIAWARSKPTTIPCFCAAAVIVFISNSWAVKKFTRLEERRVGEEGRSRWWPYP